MSMPFEIWCDYLEDRGVDTRLLRSAPTEMEVCYHHYYSSDDNDGGLNGNWGADFGGDGDGYGFGSGDGGTLCQGYTPLFNQIRPNALLDVDNKDYQWWV